MTAAKACARSRGRAARCARLAKARAWRVMAQVSTPMATTGSTRATHAGTCGATPARFRMPYRTVRNLDIVLHRAAFLSGPTLPLTRCARCCRCPYCHAFNQMLTGACNLTACARPKRVHRRRAAAVRKSNSCAWTSKEQPSFPTTCGRSLGLVSLDVQRVSS